MYRKDITQLSDQELGNLVEAINAAANSRNTQRANGQKVNLVESFAETHNRWRSNMHQGPAFLAWHRYFILKFEELLQQYDPSTTLPYWDPTRNDSRSLGSGRLRDFVEDSTGASNYNWTIHRRSNQSFRLPRLGDVVAALSSPSFDGFRTLENTVVHNGPHLWVGGDMATGRSPVDPLFYLHHCNIDRLWTIWQQNTGGGVSAYWDGSTLSGSFVPRDRNMIGIEGFDAEGVTPASVLDPTKMSYKYERDIPLEQAWRDRHGTTLITKTASVNFRPTPNVGIYTSETGEILSDYDQEKVTLGPEAVDLIRDTEVVPQFLSEEAVPIPQPSAHRSERDVYGNRKTKELHRIGCSYGAKMHEENKVPFSSVEDGLRRGYNGCFHCLRIYDDLYNSRRTKKTDLAIT